jgi:hypothetical protein
MTETTWAEDSAEKPVKKSLPKWVWFCGGGCLLALIAVVAAIAISVMYVKKGVDPAVTEPALQKVLPHDELPASMRIVFYNRIGMEQFTIQDSRKYQLQIQVHTGKQADNARKQMFDSDKPQIPADMGVMKFQDMTKGEVDVQGRTITVVRLRMEFSGLMKDMMPKEAQDQLGAMLWADVTPEGEHERLVLLQIVKQVKADTITDDELRDLLAPFHIGPNR